MKRTTLIWVMASLAWVGFLVIREWHPWDKCKYEDQLALPSQAAVGAWTTIGSHGPPDTVTVMRRKIRRCPDGTVEVLKEWTTTEIWR